MSAFPFFSVFVVKTLLRKSAFFFNNFQFYTINYTLPQTGELYRNIAFLPLLRSHTLAKINGCSNLICTIESGLPEPDPLDNMFSIVLDTQAPV